MDTTINIIETHISTITKEHVIQCLQYKYNRQNYSQSSWAGPARPVARNADSQAVSWGSNHESFVGFIRKRLP